MPRDRNGSKEPCVGPVRQTRQSNEPKERAGGRSCPVSWDAQREAEVEACIGEEASEYNIVN